MRREVPEGAFVRFTHVRCTSDPSWTVMAEPIAERIAESADTELLGRLPAGLAGTSSWLKKAGIPVSSRGGVCIAEVRQAVADGEGPLDPASYKASDYVVLARGYAVCSVRDDYSHRLGREIALGRALLTEDERQRRQKRRETQPAD